MEAACPDGSQNLAPVDTYHVIVKDVATIMLSKLFFLSVFVSPTLILWRCVCALALPV